MDLCVLYYAYKECREWTAVTSIYTKDAFVLVSNCSTSSSCVATLVPAKSCEKVHVTFQNEVKGRNKNFSLNIVQKVALFQKTIVRQMDQSVPYYVHKECREQIV